jgi:hypothetical protein
MLLMLLALAVHQLTPASCYYVYEPQVVYTTEDEGEGGGDGGHGLEGGATTDEAKATSGSYGSTEQPVAKA